MSRKDKTSSTFLRGFGKAYEIFKAITDAVKNLAGGQTDTYLSRLLTDKDRLKHVAQAIVGINVAGHFNTWKTIKLGTGLKTADDFRVALQNQGCKVSDWVNDILGKPAFTASIADQEIEVELVKVTVAELEFKDGATRQQIYNRAQELGLYLCPAEVGPLLRLQYLDQPNGEWVLVAMEPITNSDGSVNVFSVKRVDGSLWLNVSSGRPGSFWLAGNRWVFLRRKY